MTTAARQQPINDPLAGGTHDLPAPRARVPRVDSVDLLRGIVMVLMILDHTRDFTHWGAWAFDPTDLGKTWPALFFTRWVTHFCAPVFVFLAGTGAYLQLSRGKSIGELSRFLFTRGLWLVFLEFTVVRVGIAFDLNWSGLLVFAQVIWAIGVSMLVLAGLVRLPVKVIAAIGIGIILLHNTLDGVLITPWQGPGTAVPGSLGKLWVILHQGGVFPVAGWPSPVFVAAYPVLPWIGVMAAGYAFGTLYELEPAHRQRLLLRLGLALTAAFIVIRATNLYGDSAHWSAQRSPLYTVMSFVNTTKYPPSLLYLLMTLGPAIVALAWFERLRSGGFARVFVIFGRVPLFFYLCQWYTAHTLGLAALYMAGKSWTRIVGAPGPGGTPATPADGFTLLGTYVLWALAVVLLYPLCRWFADVKQRRRDWWLGYL